MALEASVRKIDAPAVDGVAGRADAAVNPPARAWCWPGRNSSSFPGTEGRHDESGMPTRPWVVRVGLEGKIGPDEVSGLKEGRHKEVNILRRSW
jgi:hypothetical protein